jgi:hypothetical protein
MIDKLIDIVLIVALIYIYLELDNDLIKNYYHKDLPKNAFGIGRFFFIALIFPRGYFKEVTLLKGWFIYLVNICVSLGIIYFVIDLFNLT